MTYDEAYPIHYIHKTIKGTLVEDTETLELARQIVNENEQGIADMHKAINDGDEIREAQQHWQTQYEREYN